MKRGLWIGGIAVVLVACIAPFLPLPFLRPSVEQSLERRLGRRVEIGQVSLSLFAGPGLSLSGVTIQEDPRAGIEPFAYAQTVEARVDLLGLLTGRRGFSSLRFGDATLNLVRTRAGEWNFQYLLAARLSDAPSIHLRGARVNLKFEQTKSVLYFDDADLDISPGNQGSLALNFSGAPARTDRSAQNFGHLFVRGSWNPSSIDQPLALRVESEPNSLDGLAKLFGRTWFDLQGQVSLNAQLTGRPSQLAVTGELQLDEGRRSDFLPSRDGKWSYPYRGTLDLAAEKLELENVVVKASGPNADDKEPPLVARLTAENLLVSPQWGVSVELNEAPLAAIIGAVHRIGAPLPDKLTADGTISGRLEYDAVSGLTGTLETRAAALTLADSPAIRAERVPIQIHAQTIAFGPCSVSLTDRSKAGEKSADEKSAGEKAGDGKPVEAQTAQVEASYKFDSPSADFKIATHGMDLDGVRAFALVPLVIQPALEPAVRDRAAADRPANATWRGSLRYQRSGTSQGAWTGEYTLENARIAIDGIDDPVHILSASVTAGVGNLAVTKMKGKAGDIPFTGEYHWDSTAERPHKFKLRIGDATAAELDRLFKPALVRGGGFIERTLRLGGATPAPDWLAQRKAEGTISIATLIAGDHKLAIDSARVLWDGPSVQISSVEGRLLDAAFEAVALNPAGVGSPSVKGELSVDLSEAAPQYRLTGKIVGVPYKGGRLDFEGRVETSGDGPPLFATLRATGTLNGRSIAFSPDADFRNVSGGFEASVQGASLRWKFTDLEVTQGSDVYLGEGTTQADGRVVLDLMNRGRQVRYTGSLVSLAAQP